MLSVMSWDVEHACSVCLCCYSWWSHNLFNGFLVFVILKLHRDPPKQNLSSRVHLTTTTMTIYLSAYHLHLLRQRHSQRKSKSQKRCEALLMYSMCLSTSNEFGKRTFHVAGPRGLELSFLVCKIFQFTLYFSTFKSSLKTYLCSLFHSYSFN